MTREPHKPPTGPPREGEKLGLRDAVAFILAALGLVAPYLGIAVGVFLLILLAVRLLG